MVFPCGNLPLPCRPFPFDPSAQALPTCIPDCHLVRTVIPCLPSYDSLGDFHCRTNQVLASFASMISRSAITEGFGRSQRCLSSFPAYSLKAGYTARSTRFCAPPCRFLPDSYAKRLPKREFSTSSHKVQVSTETGSYAPCHWSAPGILNPQHPP